MTPTDFQNLIQATPAVLAYFYNDNCAPCKALRPKVLQMIEAKFPNIHLQFIQAELFPELTASMQFFSTPTLLVFFDGKEYVRESKNVSISELEEKIARLYALMF